VTAAYLTGGLIKLRRKGVDLNLIWPGDYGVHFFSDTLATSERMISEHPELVERFLRASLEGWRDAVGDVDQAVRVTLHYARIKEAALQTEMMTAMLPLVHTGEDRIGWMKPAAWEQMQAVLVAQGTLAQPLSDLNALYTNEFVEKASSGGTQ